MPLRQPEKRGSDDPAATVGDGLVTLTEAQQRHSIGAQWPGPFPASWRVVALKHVAQLYAGGTPDKQNRDFWEDGTIPWLNSGEVNQWIIREPSAYITEAGFRSSSAKWIPCDALVMALAGQGKTKGMVAQVAIRTTCNQSMAVILPRSTVDPKFLLWWLHAGYETIRNMAGGEARDGLNLEIVGSIPCPYPPLAQQRAIAAYLDRETERINRLIAAKERLLELLAEKRRALITHAVTRGLDPAAPLRDCGIPWLGAIPQHWESVCLKRVATVIDCKHRTVPFLVEGVPIASIREVQRWEVELGDAKKTSEEEYSEMIDGDRDPRPGDVIVSRNATVGAAALVPAGQRFAMGQDVSLVRPNEALDPRFLNWTFRTGGIAAQIEAASIGATFSRINVEQIKELVIPLPPIHEQKRISLYLAERTSHCDVLRNAMQRTLDSLRERRAALISAAVTGAIDLAEAG